MTVSDVPLAVLLKIGQPEELITLMTLPPPFIIRRARPRSYTVVDAIPAPSTSSFDIIEFQLTGFESPAYKWWYVYNEGRSRTPKPAFVYMERRA